MVARERFELSTFYKIILVKEGMGKNYFYVVYDLNDNIICYLHNNIELSLFSSLRTYDINHKFNITDKNYILIRVFNNTLKVYRYCC